MKVSKKLLALLMLPVFSAAIAAEDCKDGVCPIPAPAPGAKQVQNAPKTVEEALKFLPETVMEVGGKKITKAEIVAKVKTAVPEQFIGQVPEAQLKQMIQGLLDLEILSAVAEKAGYAATEARVREMLKKQIAGLTPEQKKEVEENMKKANKTVDAFIDELAKNKDVQREIAISTWAQEKIAPAIKVSDEEVLKYYNDNKERFVSPESITASHILIIPKKPGDEASEKEAKAKAESILGQIKQGADFGKLAELESACPSGKRGKGSLGKMTKNQLDQDFWKGAFALKKGEISNVIKTQFGYHIIKLEDKTEAVAAKFDDLKADIKNYLTGEKTNQKMLDEVNTAKTSGMVKLSKF